MENRTAQKPEVRINGKTYRMRFDMSAYEEIETTFGGAEEALDVIRGGRGAISPLKKLFVILVNCQRDLDGMPPITENEIPKHTSMAKVREISDAITAAFAEGMRSETTGGYEADEEAHDVYLEEIEKNGQTGDRRGHVSYTDTD